MLSIVKGTIEKIEDKKWTVAIIAAGIAVAAAAISLIVYFSKKEDDAEDCFAD